MKKLSKTRTLCSITCGFLLATSVFAFDPIAATPVEQESSWWIMGDVLGTIFYRPSKREQPYFSRLSKDEVATGSHIDDYNLTGKDKKYVGWFGIVREITEDADADRTVLVVEHKYFDGLTDAHLQAVSFNGSGDFQATLSGTGHRIPPLSLVKVYGTVAQGKQGEPPRINAVFVRDWHWGTFTFLAAYGKQRGSEKWRKANQVPLDEIYEPWPHPCHHYYEERLGMRPDAPEIRKRLIGAAGSLSPEARQAMERLVDLLAVGHSWSEAESFRQVREASRIRELVNATDSRGAAVNLLIEALNANDERVSWSASEKLAAFDPDGNAVRRLVALLDHKSPRVCVAAARGLSSGYGAKAAPAAAALSRCVARSDSELERYAVLALSDIGPRAKIAAPALKKAMSASGQSIRADVARALLKIDREPADLVPFLVKSLQKSLQSDAIAERDQRDEIVALLGEMGSWAAPAVPELIEALKGETWSDRSGVMQALGKIGPKAAKAIPALCKALRHDEDRYLRSNAAEALGKIGDSRAISSLVAALEDDDDFVRFCAIDAVERFGHKAKAALPALVRLIENDKENGWRAAAAVGAIDAEGASTLVLIEALGSDDATMRRFAADGLGRIGTKAGAAERALHRGLRDRDPAARIAAAEAHWSVSGEADEAVHVLRSVIQTSDRWTVQMWAADAIARIGPPAKAAVPELVECLTSDTKHVVTSAVEALGRIGPDSFSAVPALTTRLKRGDDPYVRVCIARALWRIGSLPESLPVLRDVIENSQDFMAVSEAASAIGEMGRMARTSAPLLEPLLKSSDSSVRKAAATALKQLELK